MVGVVSSVRCSGKSASKLGGLLMVASVVKILSESGTRNLDIDKVSDHLVAQVLQRTSIDASKKVDFFQWCSQKSNFKHSADAYSLIFRIVCRAGCLDQVPLLLESMKRDAVLVDSATFKLLLDEFIRSGKFDSALNILDHLEQVGASANLSLNVYNSVLVALVRKNQLSLALSIFFKLLEASNEFDQVGPDALACNQLLVALRKANMQEQFQSVFDQLREKKCFEWDTWFYNVCIHAFGCWGHLDISLSLFKEMKEMNHNSGSSGPDLCTYNSLVRALCLAGKVNDAIQVWEELKVSGHEPDAYTYRVLIQGCCKSYRMNEATRLFSDMQYNGFCPDTLVYNAMLDGLFKAKRIPEACQLFEKMVQDGVRATCWTHNIVIDGLFRNGKGVAAYTLFGELKKKGPFVDAVTYSIVVLNLCKEDQLDEAMHLVEEMEVRGFIVDLVTVTSLLVGLHRQGRWDSTDRLLKHIRDGYLVPNVLKWTADMEASLKSHQSKDKDLTPMFPSAGNLSEVISFINSSDCVIDSSIAAKDGAAKDKERPSNQVDPWSSSPFMDLLANQANPRNNSVPHFPLSRGRRVQGKGMDSFNIDMVNTYLSIFLAKGKLSLACKLFEIFTDAGVHPVTYTYNSMMTSFVKKGYFDQAWGILHEMGENICPSDIATYNLIIQGLGKMKRADLACAVLDKLMKQGGYLDVVMYNTLINALGKDGRIEEATKFFEQMRTSGVNPDIVTYNTLIEVHTKSGRLKDAYKYLKMMIDAGCSPNHVTDSTLDFLGKEIERLRYQRASIMHGKE